MIAQVDPEIAGCIGDVDATLLVDMAHFAGLVAGGVLTGDENPIPHAHVVTVAHAGRGRCADLLSEHPLYPGIDLAV